MFYSTQILSRKGPLATIWIACHLEKRLKRAQIFETSIAKSVDSILNPEAPLALRLSGQLLLGIVRVYIRKLQLLEADAQEAISGLQDLERHGDGAAAQGDQIRAHEAAITLPPLNILDPDAFLFGGEDFPGTLTIGAAGLSQSSSRRRSVSQGSASLVTVEDVSELWGGSQGRDLAWDDPDAVFGDGMAETGEEIDRRFSIELERLRSAAVPEMARNDDIQGSLLNLHGEPPSLLPGQKPNYQDEPDTRGWPEPAALDTPEAGALAPAASPYLPALPGSAHNDADHYSQSGGRISDILPPADLGGAMPVDRGVTSAASGGGQDGGGHLTPPGTADRPASRRRVASHQGRRLRKPTIDRTADGKPQTEIPAPEMRALLMDRSAILRPRDVSWFEEEESFEPAFGSEGSFFTTTSLDDRQHHLQQGENVLPNALSQLLDTALSRDGSGRYYSIAQDTPVLPSWTLQRAEGDPIIGMSLPTVPEEEEEDLEPERNMEVSLPPSIDAGHETEHPWQENLTPGFVDARLGEESVPASGGDPFAAAQENLSQDQERRASMAGTSGLSNALLVSGSRSLTPYTTSSPSDPKRAGGGFTARSQMVLGAVTAQFAALMAPDVGSKRRRSGIAAGGNTTPELKFSSLLAGRGRSDAARWFFELLVLQNGGQICLSQDQPYADIGIRSLTVEQGDDNEKGGASPTPATRRRPLAPLNE